MEENSGDEQLKAVASPQTWDGIVGKVEAQILPEGRWLQEPWRVLGDGGHTQYCLRLSVSAPVPGLPAASSQGPLSASHVPEFELMFVLCETE